MGFRDWLYGPVVYGVYNGGSTNQYLAPLTINIDDIRDFDTKLRGSFDKVSINTASGGERRSVPDIAGLFALPAYDRTSIDFSLSQTDAAAGQDVSYPVGFLALSSNEPSLLAVDWEKYGTPLTTAVDALSIKAKRHVLYRHIRAVSLAPVPILLVALFAWAVWNYRTTNAIPILAILGLALLPTGWQMWAYVSKRLDGHALRYGRIRIETLSRREMEEMRYTRKRDRLVALYTGLVIGPIGAGLGVLVTVLVS